MDIVWEMAQANELQWHKQNPWRADTGTFIDDTASILSGFGFYPRDFRSVIDAGAGPRVRAAYFTADITVIEPLAQEYISTLEWCDLDEYRIFSVPLESFIPGLHADFLMCLNCLDHVSDFEKCIENMAQYADKLFLSFDSGETDPMHPLKLDGAYCEQVFEKYKLKIDKKEVASPWREGVSLNYWMKT
jgi:hypothetical protein